MAGRRRERRRGRARWRRALRRHDARRAVAWSSAVAAMCVFALLFTPLLGGEEGVRLAHQLGLAAIFVACVAVVWIARDPERFTWPVRAAHAGVLLVGALVQPAFYGAQSALSSMGLLFVAVYFSFDRSGWIAVGVPIALGVGYAVTLAAVLGGWLPPGVLEHRTDAAASVFFVVLAVAFFALTGLWGAASADWSARLMREVFDLSRTAARQEGLIAESVPPRRAVRPEVGAIGAYTGAVAGRFLLRELLGAGGMAQVYAAQALDDDTRAAVKVMRLELHARDPDDLSIDERFVREGTLAARVRSPHVAVHHQVGRLSRGVHFIAMERLRGTDLGALLKRRQGLTVDELLELVRHAATGLHAAHEVGVVHRDVKPSNLFRHEPGDAPLLWKVLDFGVAAALDAGPPSPDAPLFGTIDYMAPEQLRGEPPVPQTDVWGLAATTYRVLTGRSVTVGRTPAQRVRSILVDRPYRPTDLEPSLPGDVEHALALGLHPEPDRRLATPLELADALERAFVGGLPSPLIERAVAAARAHPWRDVVASRVTRER